MPDRPCTQSLLDELGAGRLAQCGLVMGESLGPAVHVALHNTGTRHVMRFHARRMAQMRAPTL